MYELPAVAARQLRQLQGGEPGDHTFLLPSLPCVYEARLHRRHPYHLTQLHLPPVGGGDQPAHQVLVAAGAGESSSTLMSTGPFGPFWWL